MSKLAPSAASEVNVSDKIALKYETFGNPKNPPILLLSGLGAQMTNWPVRTFVAPLVEQYGYYVIRMDNRDSGLSTYLSHLGTPNILRQYLRIFLLNRFTKVIRWFVAVIAALKLLKTLFYGQSVLSTLVNWGWTVPLGLVLAAQALGIVARLIDLCLPARKAPYTLKDMAGDCVKLLDSLGIQKAHWIGASMGGMICQEACLTFPSRVQTITSIMSSTGGNQDHLQTPLALGLKFITREAPKPSVFDSKELYLEACIKHTAGTIGMLSLPGHTFDGGLLARETAEYYCKRNTNRTGVPRQLMAIATAPPRCKVLGDALRKHNIPLLVIHGKHDPLVPVSNAHHMKQCVPEAQVLVVDDMGHNLCDQAMYLIVPRLHSFVNNPLKE